MAGNTAGESLPVTTKRGSSNSLTGDSTLTGIAAETDLGAPLLEEEVRKLRELIHSKEEEEEDNQPIQEQNLLPQDVYSFFAVSSLAYNQKALLCGCVTVASQCLILSLLIADTAGIVVHRPPGNLVIFRIAQLWAVTITVFTQDELLHSLDTLQFGYHGAVLRKAGLEVSYPRWKFSLLLRFAYGLLSLTASFILVLSQDTIRDIILNTTAVWSISAINPQMFSLVARRYFGYQIAQLASQIESATCPIQHKPEEVTRCCIGRIGVVFLLVAICVGLCFGAMALGNGTD